MRFFKCQGCGNFVTFLNEKSGCTPKCCGETMKELTANTTDGAKEKHVPMIEEDGKAVTVTVGSAEHPMIDAHYIQWIILETKQGYQKKDLHPGEKPVARFALSDDDEVVAAYEYCNLHGFWKAEK